MRTRKLQKKPALGALFQRIGIQREAQVLCQSGDAHRTPKAVASQSHYAVRHLILPASTATTTKKKSWQSILETYVDDGTFVVFLIQLRLWVAIERTRRKINSYQP